MTTAISIRRLSEISGVTSRTLRHYEAIGLLQPHHRSNTGERFYSIKEQLKLQQILVLRELALPLEDIARLLEGKTSAAESLRAHLVGLRAKQKRFADLVASIELTIEKLENEENIVPEDLYEGFRDDPYAEEAQERWPDNYSESQRRLKKLSKEQQQAVFDQGNQNHIDLAELFKAGLTADSNEVQQVIARHYNWICEFWTPNKDAYINLGAMYVADPRFKANYEKFAPGMAVFMRDAMKVWANANLV